MIIKKISFFLTLLILLTSILRAQNSEKPVAKIGNISISQKEFQERFELAPQSSLPMKNITEALKKDFLYTLIAEKLLAQEALEKNLDTSDVVKYNLDEFKKMFVRDALYRKEIMKKSRALADTLMDSYIYNPSTVSTKYIISNNEKDINNLYDILKKGLSFDSLYVELAPLDTNKMTISIGQFNPDIERDLFFVKENSFSKPIFINNNWFIFKIIKRDFPILEKSEGWEAEYNHLEKIAKERAENIYYERYKKNFFVGKKIEANGFLLKSLAEKVSAILIAKQKTQKPGDKIFLELKDLLKIESEFGKDTLNMTYIILGRKNIILNDFIGSFRFDYLSTKKTDFKTVLGLLNSRTKKYIEQELLAEEGFKEKLQNTADVKESYDMWRDNYLNQLLQTEFIDSSNVTDEEAYAYYSKNKKGIPQPEQVNIVEVLTDSLEVAEKVLNELDKGTDIHELAKLYSKRTSTKKTNGEFGFFPVTMNGEIGRIAAKMEVGQIYGPLRVDKGYSIFKLIGKKDATVKPPAQFEKEKDEIKRELGYKKMHEALINYIVKLANKFGVKINDDVLKSIPVTSTNAMVYRLLGFGGKITAVPLISPNSEWYKPWLESKKELP